MDYKNFNIELMKDYSSGLWMRDVYLGVIGAKILFDPRFKKRIDKNLEEKTREIWQKMN